MVRNGLRGRTQRYKSNDCGRCFDGGIRRDKAQVITDYVEGKQTLAQLAVKYGVNEKTIRHETIAQYVEGVDWLRSNMFRIYGVVIDGIKGYHRL